MNEVEIEKEIQKKGLNAPRLTPTDIDSKIERVTFTELPSGKCTVCEIVLTNGFSLNGSSAHVSLENRDEKIGNDIAFQNARQKIWQLEGYLLQERNQI